MGVLFTSLRQALGSGANTQAIALRRGIGSIDYFDRYMVFGNPDDDLPEPTFDTALQQLADGTPGTEADELLLRLRDDTQRITRRIQYKRTAGTPYRLPRFSKPQPSNTATSPPPLKGPSACSPPISP